MMAMLIVATIYIYIYYIYEYIEPIDYNMEYTNVYIIYVYIIYNI